MDEKKQGIAKSLVGFAAFYFLWGIIRDIDLPFLAAGALASDATQAPTFALYESVIQLALPAFGAFVFVASKAGDAIIGLVAMVVGLFESRPTAAAPRDTVTESQVREVVKSLQASQRKESTRLERSIASVEARVRDHGKRIDSVESTLESWEAQEDE
ncbi:MAG: hypothetical protein AAF989_11530 [Planctomycetota bacterium]